MLLSVSLDGLKREIVEPLHEFEPHIKLIDNPREQEARMLDKNALAAKFASANGINFAEVQTENPKLTLVGTGKAYVDLRQALQLLGFDSDERLVQAGIRLVKMGLVWPIDVVHLRTLLGNAPQVLVVEGKGRFLEDTLKMALYGAGAPEISGKQDAVPSHLLPSIGEPSTDDVVKELVQHFAIHGIKIPTSIDLSVRYTTPQIEDPKPANEARKPLYCPGCPHSISTKVPDGSRALAGIGCHYMVQWMDRETYTFTHMGGEGVNWIGHAPFTDQKHIFVNLGDGTYFHSGLMAIRAAVAARVNITYKILYNDAVAMTGGQSVEGNLTVDDVIRQVKAENVSAIQVVTDDLERYADKRYKVSHRDDLDEVQREMRKIPGCSILIYDQVCANELRRRRKRGTAPKTVKRVIINDAVCEGCGDCTHVSMCSAIEPVATDLGLKRRINLTSCNQDLSCLRGYCPALIEIDADLKSPRRELVEIGELPDPETAIPDAANILVAGVGGTGIVTVSQVLGTAAHLEGKHASTLDMTGLAQKGGAVFANVRIDSKPVHRTQIPLRSADVLLASDPVTSASQESIALLNEERTECVVNTHLIPTSKFVLQRERDFSESDLLDDLSSCTKSLASIDADRLSAHVCGTSTTANMALLGFAWQKGFIPLTSESIEQTLELNGTLVEQNLMAFRAGRKYALDSSFMGIVDRPPEVMFPFEKRTLDELIADRVQSLTEYQDAKFAEQLSSFASAVRTVEEGLGTTNYELTRASVETYFKLLACKDEYEVARLLTHDRFANFISQRFNNIRRQNFAFAPTWMPNTRKRKIKIGSWFKLPLRMLSKFKFIRGTFIDPFKYSGERKFELRLRKDFEDKMAQVLNLVSPGNVHEALEMVRLYSEVKGFGHVKEQSWERVKDRIAEIYSTLSKGDQETTIIESRTIA